MLFDTYQCQAWWQGCRGGGGPSAYVVFLPKFSMFKVQAPAVQMLDNAIYRINHYPADSVVCSVNTYLLDSDLSGG